MKKWFSFLLTAMLLLALTACGSKAQTVTLLSEDAESGISTKYTMEADGDIVHTITQVTTMDCADFTEEQIDVITESVEQYKAIYAEVDGVTYDVEITETAMTETIVIDASNEATMTALSENNLMPIEGEGAISLEKTVDAMSEQGWTVQK